MEGQTTKKHLENLHLDYLCKNFELTQDLPDIEYFGAIPDLFGGKYFFEMKSKSYPLKQKGIPKNKNYFSWILLSEKQIKRYENLQKTYGIDFFWIFIIGTIPKPATSIKKFSEKIILHRDIYVFNWDIYRNINLSNAGKDRRLGINTLEKYAMYTKVTHSRNLFIDKRIESQVYDFFNL